MRKFYLMMAALIAVPFSGFAAVAGDLIITEVVEGTASNYKWIEIYNRSGSSINLATDNIALHRSANGGAFGSVLTLTGTIPANGRIVVANNSTDFTGIHGTAATIYSTQINHNGNDAFQIVDTDGPTVIDSFAGDWGGSGISVGTGSAENGVYYRVLSAMPNNGNWGGNNNVPIADGANSPSGFWKKITITASNANAAAVTTPFSRSSSNDEVPVSMSSFSIE